MERLITLIDTHIHPLMIIEREHGLQKNDASIDKIIYTAHESHVKKMICISTDEKDNIEHTVLSQQHNELYAAIGIHPCDLDCDRVDDQMHFIKNLIQQSLNDTTIKVAALGEIGLDFYHTQETKSTQEYAFRRQLEYAQLYNIPIVIHSRSASDETLALVAEYAGLSGVLHCFNDSEAYAREWIKLGFALGIGGYVTYPKNILLRDTLKKIGPDKIILETDAPFLAPQALRGTTNTPANIRIIAEYLANLYELSLFDFSERILQTTLDTFPRLKE